MAEIDPAEIVRLSEGGITRLPWSARPTDWRGHPLPGWCVSGDPHPGCPGCRYCRCRRCQGTAAVRVRAERLSRSQNYRPFHVGYYCVGCARAVIAEARRRAAPEGRR